MLNICLYTNVSHMFNLYDKHTFGIIIGLPYVYKHGHTLVTR